MRLLALDTATESCSVALLCEGGLVAREAELERGHAEHVLPMIDELLGQAGVSLASLDAIAFGRGPGSFTGVRLAASITQGLAYGSGVGVVPVSDLQALAQRALGQEPGLVRVLACSDARMREVYWACFEVDAQGLAMPVSPEQVGKPDTVQLPPAWCAAQADGAGIVGAGRGLRAHPALTARLQIGRIYADLLPGAREIAILAAPRVARGERLSPDAALPVYLRDDVAQARPGSGPGRS